MKMRFRGLNRKLRLSRWAIACLAIVVALASVGITYAGIKGPKPKHDPPVSTASCSDPFTWVASNDDGVLDYYGGSPDPIDPEESSLDPSAPQLLPPPPEPPFPVEPCVRYDKDVAKTEADIGRPADEPPYSNTQYISVNITNAYPSYHPTVFFALECPESRQGWITGINLDDVPLALTVTTSGIYVGQEIPTGGEIVGALHIHVEQWAEQNTTYEFSVSIETDCSERGTAYAYGGPTPTNPDYNYDTCFIGMHELRKPPWGWTNGELLGPDYYEFPMYEGASHCDISGGRLVGTVTIDYNGSRAIITYTITDDDYTMDVTHLYVGNDSLPEDNKGRWTVSPGQYPYTHTHSLEEAKTYTYTITGLSGNIYVIAHAVVCWFQ